MRHLLIVVILLSIAMTTKAQFQIDGEYRPRFEFRDGYAQLKPDNSSPAYFVSQRTRLNLSHTYNNLYSRISVQDYRVWGDSKLKSDDPGLSVFEAYFKLKLSDSWALTAGRQRLNFDNNRLFSQANWHQISSSHDGLTVDFKKELFNFRMVTAFNQSATPKFGTNYTVDNYKFLNVIWLEKKFKYFSLANLTITDSYQKKNSRNTDYYRFTIGLVAKYKRNSYDLQLRGFYQTGKNKMGTDVNAHFINAIASYKFGSALNLTLGTEYMSGNDFTNHNGEDNAFDILYGARHWFNGIMDYFSIPKTTLGTGLIDGYLKLDFLKIESWKLSAHYHYLATSNTYVHNGKEQDNFLANELDLIGTWKINKVVGLQLGYAMLFAGETLENMNGGSKSSGLQQFFYTAITVKPTFFKN
ncbi:MAG: alginate export family protein [Bacteroidales bacterium]|nr:alginate export family protein [Bacteroidales bacterium]